MLINGGKPAHSILAPVIYIPSVPLCVSQLVAGKVDLASIDRTPFFSIGSKTQECYSFSLLRLCHSLVIRTGL